MAYTHTWNSSFEDSPADDDAASEGALRIRNFKKAIRERITSDHYFNTSGTDADHGKHEVITLVDNGSDPSNPSTSQRVIWNNGGTVSLKDNLGNVSRLGSIPSGTKMLFKNGSAPTGWTFASEDNDRAILNTSTEADGDTTGGSWTISGISAAGHALSESELPAISGYFDLRRHALGNNSIVNVSGAFSTGTTGYTDTEQETLGTGAENLQRITYSFGSGGSHTHGISSDGSWRPSYVKVITCTKD